MRLPYQRIAQHLQSCTVGRVDARKRSRSLVQRRYSLYACCMFARLSPPVPGPLVVKGIQCLQCSSIHPTCTRAQEAASAYKRLQAHTRDSRSGFNFLVFLEGMGFNLEGMGSNLEGGAVG